ncbi:carbonic anhydrase [Serratia sp. AKBS12]|uniref:carbonic anhydrase n=1 Tax=Serratia sp. AKBS12 TaxID=2974597 RepID=UPI002165EC3F|nr:carbonic anhydrase [Serratia sp. AKBS12]MCS3406143.1 carbonic anhydrase [Serratia sp. AKBS12]HEI8867943.1 carbonic anhydrase [Serratia odorifera]
MTILKPLLARNRSWALQQRQRNPHYFRKHVAGQQPQALWIGCSDSRVPAEVLTGAHPGELFVHRNIANMVLEDDDSLMSVLQYALDYLHVSAIVLCGHYGCGGVQAAVNLPNMPLSQEDSALARRMVHLRRSLASELQHYQQAEDDETTRLNRLIEAHVVTQVGHLIASQPVRQAWEQGKTLDVFGCVYDLQDGHLKELVHQDSMEASHELKHSA